jgi:hypothetical protein
MWRGRWLTDCLLSGKVRVASRRPEEAVLPPAGVEVVTADLSDPDTLVRHLVAADGRPAPVPTTYQDLTGEPGHTYADWTVDHADDFR